MLDKILSENNLNSAMEDLLSKKDSCGIDGMRISELKDYLTLNGDSFYESIRTGNYLPGIVQEIDILGKTGKTRTISKLITLDRFVLRAIYQVMQATIAPSFSKSSYAYQDNKGILDAAKSAREFLLAGLTYSVDIDIDSFFDNINHVLLLQILNELVFDEMLLKIIGIFFALQG